MILSCLLRRDKGLFTKGVQIRQKKTKTQHIALLHLAQALYTIISRYKLTNQKELKNLKENSRNHEKNHGIYNHHLRILRYGKKVA